MTQSPCEEPAPQSATPVAPVGDRAIAGASWLLMQTVAARVLSLVGQIFLARLLFPDDFTLFNLAVSVCVIFALIPSTTLGDILVQRQRHFRRWANTAFWMSAATAALILLLALVLAPLAGWIFHNLLVAWLVLILGANSAVNALSIVWASEHAIRFHFRLIAAVNTLATTLATVSAIAFAWLGMKSFSLALPLLISALTGSLLYFFLSPFRPHGRMHFRRWRFLLGDNLLLAGCAFCSLITMQADKFFLGLFHQATMGYYVWAYALSLQFLQLVAGSVRGVLLPAFSSISGDRARADAAFLQAARMVSLVSIPACILLIPAMPALVRHVFSAKWDDSVPLIQIFLPTMGLAMMTSIATATFQSRGLLKRYFVSFAISAAAFVALVWSAAFFANPTAVAITVSIFYGIHSVVMPFIATAPSTTAFKRQLLAAIAVPFALAALSAIAAWLAVRALALDERGWACAALSLAAGFVLYAALARLMMPDRINSAIERGSTVLFRRRK